MARGCAARRRRRRRRASHPRHFLTPPTHTHHPPPPPPARAQLHWCLDSLQPTPFSSAVPPLLQQKKGSAQGGSHGVSAVLRSLTANHRSILALLLAHRLESDEPLGGEGLLKLCAARMVCHRMQDLRAHLTELLDHKIVAQRGGAYLVIADPAEVERALAEFA